MTNYDDRQHVVSIHIAGASGGALKRLDASEVVAGLYAKVLRGGSIGLGDSIAVIGSG